MRLLGTYIVLLTFLSSCLQNATSPKLDDVGLSAPEDFTIVMLSVMPARKIMTPGESFTFEASGGSGEYTFSVDSGDGEITNAGVFTAAISNGTTTIKVADSSGNTAYAVVTVGSSLSITQSASFIQSGETATFEVSNGVAPYEFYVVNGDSIINSTTGQFTAGSDLGTIQVGVRDAGGKTALATIDVLSPITIASNKSVLKFSETANITATGGVSPYTFSVVGGSSFINSATGFLLAGFIEEDILIRVTDSIGLTKDLSISIVSGPTLSGRDKLATGSSTQLSVVNAVGSVTYQVVTGAGTVSASGLFTSGSDVSTTTIRATDSNGYSSDHIVNVFIPRKIFASDYSTCILSYNSLTDTSLKCFGDNYDFNLGDYTYNLGDDPDEMGDAIPTVDLGTAAGASVVALSGSASNLFRCAIFNNNKVKCWGYNANGELGIGSNDETGSMSGQLGDNLPFAQLGDDLTSNPAIPVNDRVVGGANHLCAIVSGDNVKCWGLNSNYELGHFVITPVGRSATTIGVNMPYADIGTTVKRIAAGYRYSCAILSDDTVKCWGENNFGVLGNGSTVPTKSNPVGQRTPSGIAPVDLNGVGAKEIAGGYYHVCVLLVDNSVKCWGYNVYGQLGLEDNVNRGDDAGEMGASLPTVDLGLAVGEVPVSIKAGYYHTCVLLNTGNVKCWGYNSYGETATGLPSYRGDAAGEMGTNLPYADLGTGRTATKIFANQHSACALLDNGQLKCWGHNGYGQLAHGNDLKVGNDTATLGDNMPAVSLSSTNNITNVFPGHVACYLLDNATVKCAGASSYGARGTADRLLGDEPDETPAQLTEVDFGTGFEVKDVFMGLEHTCAINMNNDLKCIGRGTYGRLGMGNSIDYGEHRSIAGNNVPLANISSTEKIVQGTGGQYFSCGLLDSGRIKCWGRANVGQVGNETTTGQGHSAATSGDNMPYVDLGTLAGNPINAKKVSAGSDHACAILENDRVKCWGGNTYGQLGQGHVNHLGDDAGEMGDNLSYVDLGSIQTVKEVVANYYSTCVIRTDDKIFCWGKEYVGNLGNEMSGNIGDDPGEMGVNLKEVNLGTGLIAEKLVLGAYRGCVIVQNGLAKCWGYNSYGDLGIASNVSLGNVLGQMGDALPFLSIDPSRKVIGLGAGFHHQCAVLDDNAVKCWGYNHYGQLGLGHRYHMCKDAFTCGDRLPELSF